MIRTKTLSKREHIVKSIYKNFDGSTLKYLENRFSFTSQVGHLVCWMSEVIRVHRI